MELDGQPWFVAADVCAVLKLTNVSKACSKLTQGEIRSQRLDGGRYGRPSILVAESGLYKLIMRSDKPEAKAFQDWVTREVLPAIRKDGGYILGEEKVRSDKNLGRAPADHDTNNEPRVLDTDLAEALGMKMPRFIRKNLIEPNIDELRRYGNLSAINSNSGKPGRSAMRYYLNREQANLVSIFSRTPKAADVREEIIKVFTAYQDGHLELSETGKIALPNFANPAEAARA